jgi:phosphate:Na+ symporter
MVIMTDSLRSLAGRSVRTAILKFTRTPLSGVMTGAVGTAILQSSSATTVAAVGFVGAGLMAFPEAVGIVLGANIGTTLKGWVIAFFGFKYDLASIALPVIFLGVVVRLFTTGKWSAIGFASAGFGLIFVAIGMLQTGMSGLEGVITPDVLPADTWWGRIQLVFLGMLITVITQSSSAGVAAALTAVFLGTINFHQAAAMVIGMDVGTTITALMATIGSSTSARRTGLSHVFFNLITGSIALFLISPYVWLWDLVIAGGISSHAEIALAAFHTAFNLLGVMLFLPLTRQYASLLERLVPDRFPIFLHDLSALILRQPAAAINEIQMVIGRMRHYWRI